MKKNLHTVAPFYMHLMPHPLERCSECNDRLWTNTQHIQHLPYSISGSAWLFCTHALKQAMADPENKHRSGADVRGLTRPIIFFLLFFSSFLKHAAVMCWQMSMARGFMKHIQSQIHKKRRKKVFVRRKTATVVFEQTARPCLNMEWVLQYYTLQ